MALLTIHLPADRAGEKKYKLSPTTSVPSRQSFAATRLEEAGAS